MHENRQSAASFVYRGFRFLCHQYPWRSFFLYGEQPYYPLNPDPAGEILSYGEALGTAADEISPRDFYGTQEMGYKMAICQRDTAIYPAMALFCLIYFISGNRIPKLNWKLFALFGALPMGADGITQLLSHALPQVFPMRESNPLLRVTTGALFGFFFCWFLIPTLEQSLQEGEKNDRK